ncbi:uncharacterized protein cubi_02665 [Cryptosporidium ubiquitum]|uniref:Secreted protein n=1 Tax=Cryptosporidium ubiquitum TaxID=857276 RepID=A0A1J4MKR4_9CRYT|nr:uncharacterized protein cubi_02665 [Cryptosporidium ubiquitum]OII73453.1 hypothetical protein cubi_02665 [Cryptosporidium ubiquitum]
MKFWSLYVLLVFFINSVKIPRVYSKRKKPTKIEIEEVSGVLSSDLYGSSQSLDLSQTLYGSSLLTDNYEISNSESSARVIDLKNVESISPTNDIFPLRNKEIKNLYMKSINEKKVYEIRNLNKDIAENYPNSSILSRNKNGEIISDIDISIVISKLEQIKNKDLPSIEEEELKSEKVRDLSQLDDSRFLSQEVLDHFNDVFGAFLSIPKETKADILLHIHKILEESTQSLSNLPEIFYGNGIQVLLQPFSDLSINPSEILKIYSSLFEENSDNFIIFLDLINYILTSTISSSKITSLAVSRYLKESDSNNSKSKNLFKQNSSNFWYNTICQTIQNIELLAVVYPFLIPPSYKKVATPVEVIHTPKTPTLGGFKEYLEKGEEKKIEMIETSNTLTQELIFGGWKESIYSMGHQITSDFFNTKSLCIKFGLINSKKENIEDVNESYQIRKFKGLFKDFKNDEELEKHDKINYLNSIGLQSSSIKLSTDERQSIITTSTNYLLEIANILSEVDLLTKCYSFISNSKSIENKNTVLQMDPELGSVLRNPYAIEKIPLDRWKYIVTLIPSEFKKSCTIALHSQYIECYNKYKQLHYTLQQPTVVGKIISKLQESSDVIGENAVKTLTTSFSWKSLYQADATFTYYFSILDLNRLIGFNQIIINVVSRYEPIKDIYSLPSKETKKTKALKFWNTVKGTWIFRIATFGLFSFIGYIDKGYTVEKCLYIPKARKGEPEPTIIW